MAKKQESKKEPNYIQQPLNGMEVAGCVCSGEMFIGDEAADLIAKIPLNPLATPEMIKALKHETEPLDCVFIVDYQFSKSGVEYLDSYDGNHGFYTKNGFEPVCYISFNEKFAPKDWRKGIDRNEDIVFYKYTGNKNMTEWNNVKKDIKYFDDYDEAMKYRDSLLKKQR